ncbi:carbohydrate ABC transporter permease [Paenibacillus sp. SEL1]|uniref:Sugar ABC transporter permease n=1 Tax=Paenibacillus polymyxa TaxID=1406 RepID=A0AAE9L797_PAEPO|nr:MULTISPECIES: sugar ABC transporter permease [Paenibacillus]MCF2717610.1 sugar ABC transporter permease [Paenibacillus sp. UKAQ_18]MCP3780150.1 sugar ABC transporter permease [Paenibacillus sp. MZ03-122A]MCP3795872.1 sugar ABC transporter permease [Paenibacillus sp. CH40]MDQ0047065.1 multiple sugar transport system permease protein [Paenibacillus polymyxa]URJ48597.1 sugar ABC transporter permease [Paenibacillus polymyxa]
MKRPKSGMMRMERNWGLLFALPAILGLMIFTIGPIAASFVFSLTDWTIGGQMTFIGLDNYRTILTEDATFSQSMFVTTYYALGSVPLGLAAAFIIALLLNQKVKGLSVFRTIYYLPTIVPSIANTMLWLWMFNPDFGLLNSLLEGVGLPGSKWIYDESTAIPSLIMMSTWGIGNTVIIFLAGLQSVPTHLYEAAEVDGGNRWHKFFHITIPSMTPTIFFNLVMSLISTFQAFNQAYVMTNGGPNNSTLFYVFYLWRTAFTETKIGYASALAWILFFVIMVLTVLIFSTSKKWVHYEGGERS